MIEENDLLPEDIESVKAQPHPVVEFKLWRENTLRTPEDYCFSAPYLLACAAHRINPSHWHDPEVKQDPKIRKFLQRVQFSTVVDEKDFGLAKFEDPRTNQMRITVVAKGKTFKGKAPYRKGSPKPAEFRNTDEELVKKFSDNASRVLSLDKVKKAVQTMLDLEKLENAAQVVEMVTP